MTCWVLRLQAYLSALSKRAGAQPQLGNATDLAENEDKDNPPLAVEAPSSKFLKKKKPAASVQYDEGDGAKYQPKTDVRPSGVRRSEDGAAGSALGKASGYAEKFSSRGAAGRGEILHLSESDMDLSFSLDDSILAQTAKTTNAGTLFNQIYLISCTLPNDPSTNLCQTKIAHVYF